MVVFTVLLENSGLVKTGAIQGEFIPVETSNYKFSDVHGVDEAKEVGDIVGYNARNIIINTWIGIARCYRILEGPGIVCNSWW